MCTKGKKCKYSHDLALESENLNLYVDQREQLEDPNTKDEETIKDWTMEKFNEIANQNEKKIQISKAYGNCMQILP